MNYKLPCHAALDAVSPNYQGIAGNARNDKKLDY